MVPDPVSPPPVLRLEGVAKQFGGAAAVADLDLAIAPGEFLSLLGPSGCGKTTTLRLIAGFEQPTQGRISLDGRDITALAPYDRPVNTVFQDYALFPHLTVGENVAFGLTLRRLDRATIGRKVQEALALVALSDKIDARTTALSGGQRQRVALARALVCEPRLLLLDEPLSALDAHLREQMQIELKRLQTRLGTTFVMVTHDQTEALSISDRIVVMNQGRIEQVAAPAVLYDAPATRFVARFIGTMNLLGGRVIERRGAQLLVSAGPWQVITEAPDDRCAAGSAVTLGVRPEDLLIDDSGDNGSGDTGPAGQISAGLVIACAFHGRSLRLHVQLSDETPVVIDAPRSSGDSGLIAVGSRLALRLRPGAGRCLG